MTYNICTAIHIADALVRRERYIIYFLGITLDARTRVTDTHSHEEGGPSSTNQNRIFSLALNNNNMDLGGGRRRTYNK